MAKPATYVSIFLLISTFLSYEVTSHTHSHEDHGHAHDHQGHAHDHHGHSHDHEDDDHHGHAAHDDHGHSHGLDETPQFRYSRQANEPVPAAPQKAKEESKPVQPVKRGAERSGASKKYSPNVDGQPRTLNDDKLDTGLTLWVWALGATVLVSLAPVLILIFIPLDNRNEHQPLLKILLSFASGGLLGDAFLHLIPHAVAAREGASGGHTHSHSHGSANSGEGHSHDLGVWIWVLSGIIAFFAVEKFVRCVKGDHGHSHGASAPAESDKKAHVVKEPGMLIMLPDS